MEENKIIYENDNFVAIEIVGSPANEPTDLEIGKVIKSPTLSQLLCAVSVIMDHPKWWHLYTHSKKRRVRNKYENMMSREAHRRYKSGRL